MKKLALAIVVAFLAFSPAVFAADLLLKDNDIVAINGDSITEQKEYSVLMEDYLLMCKPAQGIRAAQFGWGGETAAGFQGRMVNDVLWLKPTVATTCYGMNDGGYKPLDKGTVDFYTKNSVAMVKKFKEAGVRTIIVGSPGAVDSQTFGGNNPERATMYNKTLGSLRDIAKEVAAAEGVFFANVHDPMIDAMAKAKAKYGNAYHVCGGDGVHPGRNGQLIMAYAFLKAMGIDGNIGTITVDMAASKAEVTDGHKVLSAAGGVVEIESSRYPFCFQGNPKDPNATTGIIEFFPFNQDLNRFTLVVKNAPAGQVKVTWGAVSKEFASADLAKGINLAAEFAAGNPFSEPFAKVEQVIRKQQNFETTLHKQLLHELGNYKNQLPEAKDALDQVAAAAIKRDAVLFGESAAAVVPVKHTIKIEAVK
ncbi:MAG: SGNH/GDSL hydrolase family protein [Tepidisphaeraceae bacterium]|jgi:lysophospholipase L1-like esterase